MCYLARERIGEDPKLDGRRRELMALLCELEARTKSTIAVLPVELLLMVFDLVCRPIALSLVCRGWREIAHSYPALWHSLVLAEPPKKALHKVQEWCKRSCGRVTELTIRKSLGRVLFKPLGPYQRLHQNECHGVLIELRCLDLRHIKTCHLEDVDVSMIFRLLWLEIRPPVMLGLETFSVSQSVPRRGSPLGKGEFYIRSWANIRALRINNMTCDWEAFTIFVPGLTSFEYKIAGTPIDFEPIRYVLQANPTLERLIIKTNASSPAHAIDIPEPLIMVHLHHVELSGVTLSPLSTRNLSLPSLQVLRLSQLPGPTMILENLIDDPGTSLAGLVELTMKNCVFQRLPLLLALFCSPKLEVLRLRGDFDANAIAESLSSLRPTVTPVSVLESRGLIPTEVPILCPSLTALDLSGSPSLRTGPVMRLVKERLGLAASEDGGRYRLPGQGSDQRVSCIRSLNIDECPHIEAEMLPWFQKNVPQFSCRYATEKLGVR